MFVFFFLNKKKSKVKHKSEYELHKLLNNYSSFELELN